RLFLLGLLLGLFLFSLFFDLLRLRLLFRLLLGLLFGFLCALRLDLWLALFGCRRLAAASKANRGGGGQRQRPLHARDFAGVTVDGDLGGSVRAFVAGGVPALLDV